MYLLDKSVLNGLLPLYGFCQSGNIHIHDIPGVGVTCQNTRAGFNPLLLTPSINSYNGPVVDGSYH